MKGFIEQACPWVALTLAVMYFGNMTLQEAIRARKDPDTPRTFIVHLYFVNGLVFGIITGMMFGTPNHAWKVITIIGTGLYLVIMASGIVLDILRITRYDRLLMIGGGFGCFAYLLYHYGYGWTMFGIITEGITLLVVAMTLVIRVAHGSFRIILHRH